MKPGMNEDFLNRWNKVKNKNDLFSLPAVLNIPYQDLNKVFSFDDKDLFSNEIQDVKNHIYISSSSILGKTSPQIDKQVEIYRTQDKVIKDEFTLNYFKGILNLNNGNYFMAMDYFEKALKFNPDHYKAQRYLVTALSHEIKSKKDKGYTNKIRNNINASRKDRNTTQLNNQDKITVTNDSSDLQSQSFNEGHSPQKFKSVPSKNISSEQNSSSTKKVIKWDDSLKDISEQIEKRNNNYNYINRKEHNRNNHPSLKDSNRKIFNPDPLEKHSNREGNFHKTELKKGMTKGLINGNSLTNGFISRFTNSNKKGLINGNGLTNGFNKVFSNGNKKGLINGNGLTNGFNKGFSNGNKKGLINSNGLTNGSHKGFSNGNKKGMINGNGLTNGFHKGFSNGNKKGLINGNGLTNGNDLTNGNNLKNGNSNINENGLSNGNGNSNGSRSANSNSKKNRILMIYSKNRKARFASILIIFGILIIPAYMYFYNFSSEYEGIIIDGEFDDWAGIDYFEDDIDSSNPNIDIVEYKMTSDNYGTSFYMRVNGILMKGSSDLDRTKVGSDTTRIFIDSDNSYNTGYIIMGMGADVMIEILGFNNMVIRSNYYIFNYTQSQDDWNSWVKKGFINSKVIGGELEAQIPSVFLDSSKTLSVIFQTSDKNLNEDYTEHVISTNFCRLDAKEYFIADHILKIGSINNEFLRTELTALNSEVIIKTLTFQMDGTAADIDTGTISLCRDLDQNGYLSYKDKIIAFNERGFENNIVEITFNEQLLIKKIEPITLFVLIDIPFDASTNKTISIALIDADIEKGFLHISDINENQKRSYIGSISSDIIIDGAFDDWGNIEISYDTTGDSNKPSTDLSESAVANNNNNLYVYLKVTGMIMEGANIPVLPTYFSQTFENEIDTDNDNVPDNIDPSPNSNADSDDDGLSDDYELIFSKTDRLNSDTDGDGYIDGKDYAPLDPSYPNRDLLSGQLPSQMGKDTAKIFIDADHDSNTGYRILTKNQQIGADYIVEITGRNGRILSKDLMLYSGSGTNWLWNFKNNIQIGKDLSRMELGISKSDIPLLSGDEYDLFCWISDWSNTDMDSIDNIITHTESGQVESKAPYNIRNTRSYLPFTTGHFHPTSALDDDSYVLDETNIDEDANGDATYEYTGVDAVYSWIECGYGAGDIPTDSTINNMTVYMGYYNDADWLLSVGHTGVIWSPSSGGTENDIADYTLSTSDRDDIYTITSGLPTYSELNSGIYIRVSGCDSNGKPSDFLYLDYLYFTINYTLPDLVFNEVMFNPVGADDNSEWIELFNNETSAISLVGWNVSDNDGNTFNLSGAGSIPAGGYLMCYLAQSGTNSTSTVYGPITNSSSSPTTMLENTDDLSLISSNDKIIDYIAWGADPVSDDDTAVSQGVWTDGEYIDTSSLLENETLGRNGTSGDTNSIDDWENSSTSKAAPYGIDADCPTPGLQNVPEFADSVMFILICVLIMAVAGHQKRLNNKNNLIDKSSEKLAR